MSCPLLTCRTAPRVSRRQGGDWACVMIMLASPPSGHRFLLRSLSLTCRSETLSPAPDILPARTVPYCRSSARCWPVMSGVPQSVTGCVNRTTPSERSGLVPLITANTHVPCARVTAAAELQRPKGPCRAPRPFPSRRGSVAATSAGPRGDAVCAAGGGTEPPQPAGGTNPCRSTPSDSPNPAQVRDRELTTGMGWQQLPIESRPVVSTSSIPRAAEPSAAREPEVVPYTLVVGDAAGR